MEKKEIYDMVIQELIEKALSVRRETCSSDEKQFYETLKEKSGKPVGFYVSNENIYLYPTPDDSYTVNLEYLTLAIGEDDFGTAIYFLQNDEDAINIPEKYENIFKNALITKSMLYAIASETDENYSGYKEQYDKAYKILINYTSGLEKERKVYW